MLAVLVILMAAVATGGFFALGYKIGKQVGVLLGYTQGKREGQVEGVRQAYRNMANQQLVNVPVQEGEGLVVHVDFQAGKIARAQRAKD